MAPPPTASTVKALLDLLHSRLYHPMPCSLKCFSTKPSKPGPTSGQGGQTYFDGSRKIRGTGQQRSEVVGEDGNKRNGGGSGGADGGFVKNTETTVVQTAA